MNEERKSQLPEWAWFQEAIKSSHIRATLGRFERGAVIRGILPFSDATHAQVEVILAAMAHCPSGSETAMAATDAEALIDEASRVLESHDEAHGPLSFALRIMRGLRPAWYTAPLYAELLEPFEDLCKTTLGKTPRDLFASAVEIADSVGKHVAFPSDLPKPVLDRVWIRVEDIRSPGDLRDKVFVRIDDDSSYGLGYNAADALYWALLGILADASPAFGSRKGKALETFVRRRIEALAPTWRIEPNVLVNGREKDLLAWDGHAGLAIEAKSCRIGGRASEWSSADLRSDVRDVREALEQVEGAMEILRTGGTTDEGVSVPKCGLVQGLVVVDEPFASFVRAALDRHFIHDSDENWHGQRVWIVNFVDFHYVATIASTASVLLHYLTSYRNSASVRAMDEPEAWSAYGIEWTHAGRIRGVQIVIKEHDWDRSRTEGLEAFSPQWLTRRNLAEEFDRRRESKKALRIIQQDLDRAMREDDRRRKSRPSADAIDDDVVQAIRRRIAEEAEDAARRPKHPYRSL